MSETVNIAEIASKISKEIFRAFRWTSHPKHDDNFECVNSHHKSNPNIKNHTHPGDIVFRYEDPYLGKAIYLHTDLKSYAKESIKITNVRAALKSLAHTVECANSSEQWREKYSTSEAHEVRGLLFVHNHDGLAKSSFNEMVNRIDIHNLPIAPGTILHFLGPEDIQRLYSIAIDILKLKGQGELPDDYSFYYPDLVLRRRHGDVWEKSATIEGMTGPFIIIKHRESKHCGPGYLIYYNRPGSDVDELEYLIDCMSRFQMLESGQLIRVRSAYGTPHPEMKSIFKKASDKYARAWGFDPERIELLKKIDVDLIDSMASTYHAANIGWRA